MGHAARTPRHPPGPSPAPLSTDNLTSSRAREVMQGSQAQGAPPPATTNLVPYYYIAWRPTGTSYLALAVYCAGCL